MPEASNRRRWLPWLLGLAALGLLLALVDGRAVLAALEEAQLLRFAPLMLGFVLLWLLIESSNLATLMRSFGHRRPFAEIVAARAYSYLLLVLNYGLGLAAMTLYLRSRAGAALGRASGMMLLYGHIDMIALSLLALLGGLWAGGDPLLRVVMLVAAGYLAFAAVLQLLLRRRRLPERLRQAPLLAGFREADAAVLGRLIGGRAIYFASFIVFFYLALPAFGLAVPLAVLLAAVPAIFVIGNLPVTAAGIGTIQAAMLYFFRDFGAAASILAFSICYSAGLILLRLPLGTLVALRHPALLVGMGAASGAQARTT